MNGRISILMTRGNIEKRYFICPLLIILPRYFNRISGIPDIDKLYAFYNSPLVYI